MRSDTRIESFDRTPFPPRPIGIARDEIKASGVSRELEFVCLFGVRLPLTTPARARRREGEQERWTCKRDTTVGFVRAKNRTCDRSGCPGAWNTLFLIRNRRRVNVARRRGGTRGPTARITTGRRSEGCRRNEKSEKERCARSRSMLPRK